MGELAYKNKNIALDEEGFLLSPAEWDENVARVIAEKEGVLNLTESKMEIVHFLRRYYEKFDSFPILNYVCKNIHQPRECVNEEFIDPMKAWKIAGLPRIERVFFYSHDGGKSYHPNPFY